MLVGEELVCCVACEIMEYFFVPPAGANICLFLQSISWLCSIAIANDFG